MKSSSTRRLVNRRSPPRVVSMYHGVGVNHPMEQKSALKIAQPREAAPIKQLHTISVTLRSILSTGQGSIAAQASSSKTTVNSVEGNQSMPRIQVTSHHQNELEFTGTIPKKETESVAIQSPSKTDLGTGHTNLSKRTQLTNNLVGQGAMIEPGRRYLWRLDQPYESKKFQVNPVLELQSSQAARVTFHDSVGGILQDIEFPPQEQQISITVPPSTSTFAVEGLGGQGFDFGTCGVGTGAISTTFSSTLLPSIGFQKSSTVDQIGLYRYLGRGCFLESNQSNSKNVMKEMIQFSAGEVFEKVDSIRMFCTSRIRSFALIVRTLNGEAPFVKIAMEGVVSSQDPIVIKRQDGVAYLWDVKSIDDFDGPAIIDIITDSSTDVNSALGFRQEIHAVTQMFKEQKWVKLVDQGPLSFSGTSFIKWTHHANEPLPKMPGINLVLEQTSIPSLRTKDINRQQLMNEVIPVQKEVVARPAVLPPSPPIEMERIVESVKSEPRIEEHSPPIGDDLPELPRVEAIVGERLTVDLSIYVGDEDEGDSHSFSFVHSPPWLIITQQGLISGTPTQREVGTHVCVVRVTDQGGLSSDAKISVEVKEKILNRAPFWKPNILHTDEAIQLQSQSPVELSPAQQSMGQSEPFGSNPSQHQNTTLSNKQSSIDVDVPDQLNQKQNNSNSMKKRRRR